MPIVAEDLHRPSFADWFWWAVMTAASGVLGLVLYVLLQGEMQGFSVLWSCAPLAASYFGCPLRTHTKLLFAPVAAPAVFAPAVLVVPFYLLEPQLAAEGYALQHPAPRTLWSGSLGPRGLLDGFALLGDRGRVQRVRELEALRADPAAASRLRGCELLVGSVRANPGALASADLERIIVCARASR